MRIFEEINGIFSYFTFGKCLTLIFYHSVEEKLCTAVFIVGDCSIKRNCLKTLNTVDKLEERVFFYCLYFILLLFYAKTT